MNYKATVTLRFKILLFFIAVFLFVFLLTGWVFVKSYEASLRSDLESKLSILAEEVIEHRFYRMEPEAILSFLHLDQKDPLGGLIDNLFNLRITVTPEPFGGDESAYIFCTRQTPQESYVNLVSDTDRINGKVWELVLKLVVVFGTIMTLSIVAFTYYLYRLFRPMECLVDFCKNFSHDRSSLPACGGSAEIAQLKEAVLELLDANSKLIEQERDIFKAAAHEIKTPLAVLKARLSLFNSGEYERGDFVREANKDIDRITLHLKELLFLKSIERILLGNEETMDIYTELEALMRDFSPLLEKKSLQVFYGNKFTFKVFINKMALRKLLKAIGENMISYAEPGSVIFININPSKQTISFINKIGSEEDREMFSSQIGFKIIDHLSEKLGFSFTTTAEPEKFTTTLIFNERVKA